MRNERKKTAFPPTPNVGRTLLVGYQAADLSPILLEVARRDNPEKRRMRLKDGVMLRHHRATESHQGYADGGALKVDFHGFSISLMAETN